MQQRKAAITITRPSSHDDDAKTNRRIRRLQPLRRNNGTKTIKSIILRYGIIILSLSIIISTIGILNSTTTSTDAIRSVLEYGVLPVVVLSTAPVVVVVKSDATTTTTTTDKKKIITATKAAEASGALNSTTTTIVECFVSTPHIKNIYETTDGGTDGSDDVAEGTIRITIQNYNIQNRTTGSSAEAFMKLIDEYQFYDGSYTFRVIKDFVVQFGHHNANNNENNFRRKNNVASNRILQSDTTGDEILSNIRGTITMIPGQTGQVFINLGKLP